jgi:hypothetical protein
LRRLTHLSLLKILPPSNSGRNLFSSVLILMHSSKGEKEVSKLKLGGVGETGIANLTLGLHSLHTLMRRFKRKRRHHLHFAIMIFICTRQWRSKG